MKEHIEVETGLDSEGSLLPRAFTWRGERFAILSFGRRWSVGSRRHVLVKAPGDKTFEIVYDAQDSSWWMVRSPRDFGPRVRET